MNTAPVEVKIKPKSEILSAEDLVRLRNEEIKESKGGPKLAANKNTDDEAAQLQKLYAELKKRISVPRIERLEGRALARWDDDEQAMQVLRKDGKFENFGYNRNGKLFLEYFEAIFLLEVGRLQLEYHSMIMSVEQAYLLLLGEQASPKFNEYLVYSHFMRSGFILNKHSSSTDSRIDISYEDCVWSLCLHAVQNLPIPAYIENSPHFIIAKAKMEEEKIAIMEQQFKEVTTDAESTISLDFSKKFNILKDTTSARADSSKYRNLHPKTGPHGSFIDFLRGRRDYRPFEAVFDNIDIIQLSRATARVESCRQFEINFDLYLHHEGFKKSTPTEPELCMIILRPEDSFPTHTEISQCFLRQQCPPVPLLVVAVSESKQIQGFLYYFT